MKALKNDLLKIGVACVAMIVGACVVPATWIGVPVILGFVAMACVVADSR